MKKNLVTLQMRPEHHDGVVTKEQWKSVRQTQATGAPPLCSGRSVNGKTVTGGLLYWRGHDGIRQNVHRRRKTIGRRIKVKKLAMTNDVRRSAAMRWTAPSASSAKGRRVDLTAGAINAGDGETTYYSWRI